MSEDKAEKSQDKSQDKSEDELKGKMQAFANFYIGEASFNATRAAKLAKYTGDGNTLAVTGSRLLRNAKVSAYINEKLKRCAMSANEVLSRLTEIARGNVDDLLDDDGNFNLKIAKQRNKTHLLKKIKTKRTLKQSKTETNEELSELLADDEAEELTKQTEILFEEVEFELYSAHEALRDLGKFHKLFTEKIETHNLNENVAISIEEWRENVKKRREEAAKTMELYAEREEGE